MRSFAVALVASMAVGQALAGPTHLRHAQLHAAREAEAEAEPQYPTNPEYWKTLLNWNTIDYNGNHASATAPPAAPAAPTAVVEQPNGQVGESASAVAAGVTSAVASIAQPATTTKPKHGGNGGSSNGGSGVAQQAGAAASGLVSSIGNVFNLKPMVPDGTCSTGSGGPYTMEISNNIGQPIVWFCWGDDHGYQSSFMNAVAPNMAVGIPAGQSQTLSFTSGASGACSFGTSSSSLTSNGQMDNTWLEYTFSPEGVVDVSREVNMAGQSIAATVGSTGCKTNMSQCVFVCTDGSNSCEYAYALTNCAGQPGAQAAAQSGGCGWNGASSDTISVQVG